MDARRAALKAFLTAEQMDGQKVANLGERTAASSAAQKAGWLDSKLVDY